MWRELRARIDALAAERERYVELFERSTEAYVLTDRNGTIVDANGAAVDVLQRRRRELQGRTLAALVALERRAEFRAHVLRVAAGGPGARSWNTVFEAPGLRMDVALRVRPIDRGGPITGLCWLLSPAP